MIMLTWLTNSAIAPPHTEAHILLALIRSRFLYYSSPRFKISLDKYLKLDLGGKGKGFSYS